MVALIWTIKYDHKHYKANLVKRTQIEWLDQLRTAFVSFIDDVPTYVFLYLDTIKETGSEIRQANIRLLAQKLNQIRNSYYMVQTFLIGTDSASEKIRQDCGNLWQELISFKRYLDDHPISPAGNVDIENKIANEVAKLE